MTTQTLFTTDEPLRFKIIRPVYETLTVNDAPERRQRVLGIRLLDHVIIGNGRHYSFADSGLL